MTKRKRHNDKLTPKLTDAEANRLEQYIGENGGQSVVGADLGVAKETLSRNLNRRTAPSPMLRDKLIEKGIIKVGAVRD